MSRIRGKDTAPEKVVRSILHRMGYRFRLHGKKLPGRPDIVLPKYKTAVFVHGGFLPRRLTGPSCRVVDLVARGQYSPPDGTPADREVR
jgi:DNA mismatch endonuclease (patch repair protein)